jgi:tRNA(fMet)-specific endonuclease VapC
VTRFLLDTDCAIYAMLGTYPELAVRLSECEPREAAISAISYAEVMLGESRGRPPDLDVVDAFVSVIPVLPFDEAAARAYAQLPFRRASFDRLIAAHALSIGATVISNNEADFADIPGLKVGNWTRP